MAMFLLKSLLKCLHFFLEGYNQSRRCTAMRPNVSLERIKSTLLDFLSMEGMLRYRHHTELGGIVYH